MTMVIEAVFENGVFRPLAEADFKENHRYKAIVEELADALHFGRYGTVDLAASGIGQEQAAELRAGLQTFAEDWESEEMSIYDDHDAAKSRL